MLGIGDTELYNVIEDVAILVTSVPASVYEFPCDSSSSIALSSPFVFTSLVVFGCFLLAEAKKLTNRSPIGNAAPDTRLKLVTRDPDHDQIMI